MDLSLSGLRKTAADQLLHYRKNKSLLREIRRNPDAAFITVPGLRGACERPVPSLQEQCLMRCWVRAIDSVRLILHRRAPLKERFMVRCFGLDTPVPRNRTMRAQLLLLSMDLNVSESTMYKWRQNVLDLVIFGAIEAGALRPYGISETDVLRPGLGGR